jgi:hypothetical protein
MGISSKTRTKRQIPPARRFANAMMLQESIRKMAGREAPEEELQRQQIGKRALGDVEIQRRGRRRELGERGIEGPGFAESAEGLEENVTSPMIQAGNIAEAGRQAGAVPMLNTLLRENQPYTKTRTKQGFMGKAAPYVKMTGKIAGGIVGGIYGGAAGAKMGAEMGGKPGEAMAESDAAAAGKGGSTGFGGAGGGTSGGPPTASVQSDQALGTQNQGGGVDTQQQMGQAGNKKGMMSGLSGAFQLFGG